MIDELPQGWATATLGEISSKPQYGWTTPASKAGRTKYVRTSDISGGKIDWGSVPYCAETPDDLEKYRIRENDLLVSRAGSVGVSYRVTDTPEDAVFASYLIRFKPIPPVDPRYVEFFLKSDDYWRSISEFSAGIAVPNVNASKLASLEIPVAPFNEQCRIVAKLEKLLGKVDACQQRLARIPVLLRRFRQSVLGAACSGRLSADWRERNPTVEIETTDDNAIGSMDLPETWQWRKIGCLTIETGTTPPKKQSENYSPSPTACPFFKPTDLDAGENVREAREWLSAQGEKHARLLPAMTVCVTSIGATIGKTGLLRVRGATNQQINSIFPSKGVRPEFIFFYCSSPYFQRRILEDSSSTTLPIINKRRFEQLEFPLPPLGEQQEIVRRVEELFALADQIEARYAKAKGHVEKLTPSILAKAFRGELVPQDPNDEPASVLLKRIRSSKNKVSSEPKMRRSHRSAASPAT